MYVCSYRPLFSLSVSACPVLLDCVRGGAGGTSAALALCQTCMYVFQLGPVPDPREVGQVHHYVLLAMCL